MSFFTGFITSRRWAFEEMFRGLKRNAGANAFAVLLSALALTIPLWIALVFYGLSEPLRSLPTSVELTVFTKEGADAVKVANAVRAAPLVTSAQVIGKDEALNGADEQQFHIAAEPPLERLGHRHGRIDMSARSAARKYDLLHIPLFSYFDGFPEEFRGFSRP